MKYKHLTWHEVLHVHGFFPLPVILDANGSEREQDGGAKRHPHANPAHDVTPVVLELYVFGEQFRPRLDK